MRYSDIHPHMHTVLYTYCLTVYTKSTAFTNNCTGVPLQTCEWSSKLYTALPDLAGCKFPLRLRLLSRQLLLQLAPLSLSLLHHPSCFCRYFLLLQLGRELNLNGLVLTVVQYAWCPRCVCVFECVHACVCVCVRACLSVCMHAWMCVRV